MICNNWFAFISPAEELNFAGRELSPVPNGGKQGFGRESVTMSLRIEVQNYWLQIEMT